MKYYLITAALAHKLGVTSYRIGNEDTGYVVTAGDMCNLDGWQNNPDVQQLSEYEAKNIIKILTAHE